MKTVRLLPILLFATSALLVLKVLGLVTGTGSFSVGPVAAVAAGSGGDAGGHGAAAPADAESIEDPIIIGAPLDLAKEAEELARQQEGGDGHGGGHGAPAADAHGEAAAADAHGEAASADGHGEAAPADAHGAPADGHGEAAPADAHGAPADAHAAPADAHGEAPAADAHAAPADAHGAPADAHGAPAEGGHGEAADGHGSGPKLPAGVSTVRPEEYQPPGSESEAAVLERLAERRQELDKRAEDIDLRLKLLQAAEARLNKRFDELKSIEQQLGGGQSEQKAQAEAASEQVKGLVSMYETMKPKAAAEVFNELDALVLIEIARQMNPRKMAPILAAMNPERAARLTAALAGEQTARSIVVRTEGPGGPAPSVSPVPSAAPAPAELPKIMPAPSG